MCFFCFYWQHTVLCIEFPAQIKSESDLILSLYVNNNINASMFVFSSAYCFYGNNTDLTYESLHFCPSLVMTVKDVISVISQSISARCPLGYLTVFIGEWINKDHQDLFKHNISDPYFCNQVSWVCTVLQWLVMHMYMTQNQQSCLEGPNNNWHSQNR